MGGAAFEAAVKSCSIIRSNVLNHTESLTQPTGGHGFTQAAIQPWSFTFSLPPFRGRRPI